MIADQSHLRLNKAIYIALALYGSFALVCLGVAPRFFLPAEDAVILFQYSRHLAQHGSIAFQLNGPHTEGATDFLWMIVVSAAMRLGISPFVFSAAANVLTLIGLSVALLKIARLPVSLWRVLAAAGASALCTQIFAAASGFAVLPDALCLTLLVLAVLRRRFYPAGLAALTLCLLRPEGVVFAAPLLLSALFGCGLYPRLRGTALTKAIWILTATYVLPGCLYFAWRWHYFGELFPLPFLVKSDTHRLLHLVVPGSVHQAYPSLLLVLLLLTALASFGKVDRVRMGRGLSLFISLVLLPSAFFCAMRLDQNVANRFFYYLPLSVGVIAAVYWRDLRSVAKGRLLMSGVVCWGALVCGPLLRELRTLRDLQFAEIKSIAEQMAALPQHGVLLTTEAGYLPYFSGWDSVDAWGLNTAEFAHHFIQPTDVQRLQPDLIVMHPDWPQGCSVGAGWPSQGYLDRSWLHLTRNLFLGARDSYEVWSVPYGSDHYRARKHWSNENGDVECWLLRRSSPVYLPLSAILSKNNARRLAVL